MALSKASWPLLAACHRRAAAGWTGGLLRRATRHTAWPYASMLRPPVRAGHWRESIKGLGCLPIAHRGAAATLSRIRIGAIALQRSGWLHALIHRHGGLSASWRGMAAVSGSPGSSQSTSAAGATAPCRSPRHAYARSRGEVWLRPLAVLSRARRPQTRQPPQIPLRAVPGPGTESLGLKRNQVPNDLRRRTQAGGACALR